MARGGWKRTWIKLYPIDCLDGSIRYQLEADERGVWYDMLNFSAICATPGIIADKDNRAYPHSFIANRLNITLELFEKTLTKCIEEGRIKENSNGIAIVNWDAYQSEYQRQKPYREAKKEQSNFLSNVDKSDEIEKGDSKLAKISTIYEENIGILAPMVAEKLKDIASEYDVEWFEEAVKEACQNNARKLNYITAILERWKVDGFKVKQKQKQGEKEVNPDPDKYIKGKYGHMVKR